KDKGPMTNYYLQRNSGVDPKTLEQFGELFGEHEIVFRKLHARHVLVDVAEHQLDVGDAIWANADGAFDRCTLLVELRDLRDERDGIARPHEAMKRRAADFGEDH